MGTTPNTPPEGTATTHSRSDVTRIFQEQLAKEITLDRHWSNGDELNNAGSPAIEAAIRAGVNTIFEQLKAKKWFVIFMAPWLLPTTDKAPSISIAQHTDS